MYRQWGIAPITAALAGTAPAAGATLDDPNISHIATDFDFHFDAMGGLHFVARTTPRVQLSAQPEDHEVGLRQPWDDAVRGRLRET